VSEQAPAVTGIAALAVDCHDPAGLAGWWGRLLSGEVEVDDDGDATLRTPGGLAIDFLRVPEAKTVKNRLHLGATLADDVYDGGRWQVLRDPEGNEFCLLRPRS
jgi:catechol 2,3-dioxygenase-like lactoylglutathione lyase family enzyme